MVNLLKIAVDRTVIVKGPPPDAPALRNTPAAARPLLLVEHPGFLLDAKSRTMM
jgi:hypothetical protein